jgi:hypothetical protein
LSKLQFRFHPQATADVVALARSPLPEQRNAAAQLLILLELVRSHPGIRDRLLGSNESITVKTAEGAWQTVDIKLIHQLKDIAEDGRYHTDAVRRIRDVTDKPADDYRVFFALRKPRNGAFVLQVLGFFHRSIAYSPATLTELKKRYES